MPLYRSKRLIYEADRWSGSEQHAHELGLTGTHYTVDDTRYMDLQSEICIEVHALRIQEGDYLVRYVDGTRRIIASNVFEATHEDVDTPAREEQEVQIPITQFTQCNMLQTALDDAWVALSAVWQALPETLRNSQSLRESLRHAEHSLGVSQR